MKRASFVVAAAMLSSLFSVGCESNKDDFFMRMTTQPKYKYYQVSEFWDDGRAMRTPPEGTVSQEVGNQLPLLDWQNADGTYKDSFPPQLHVTAEFVRKGQHKFNIVCGNCHGLTANGHAIPGENMALHPAPSLVALKDKPVGYFFEVATNGYGLMPSFKGELSPEERWEIASYIRALQLSSGAPFDSIPPDAQKRLTEKREMPPETEAGEKKETL